MSTTDDLSNINNLNSLQAKIRSVKRSLKEQELDLSERWKQLPQETIKATVGTLIPFFLNNKVAGSTWRLLRTAMGLLIGKRMGGSDGLKENLWKSTRQLGMFTLLKGVFTLLKKRKAHAAETD